MIIELHRLARNAIMPLSNKKNIKDSKIFTYYAFILCIVAGCATVNESVSNSETIKSKGMMPHVFGYAVNVSPVMREFGTAGYFYLDEELISAKIFEVLSKSFVLSPRTTENFYATGFHPDAYGIGDSENKGEGDLEQRVFDYNFSINIGWDEETFLDELFDDSFRPGWVAGSLGLFPVTMSDKIIMDIYVTSKSATKAYHYEKFVAYVYWAPVSLTKMAMTGHFFEELIDRKKFIPKIEKMMEKFIKDFSAERQFNYNSAN
jgi:hypothetical protein